MEELELVCLQIITNAGEARSLGMEALHTAEKGEFEKAQTYLDEADACMKEAHDIHTKLIVMDAGGELAEIRLILIHSEDIMMGAEITLSLVKEMIKLYSDLKRRSIS